MWAAVGLCRVEELCTAVLGRVDTHLGLQETDLVSVGFSSFTGEWAWHCSNSLSCPLSSAYFTFS